MKDIVREYQENFRRSRKQLRRYTALLLALALTTTLFVNWQLHSVGIAKTADYQCGLEEHDHTAACYTKVLVCGYEEGEPEYSAAVPDESFDSSSAVTADDSYGISTYEAEPEPEFIFVPHEHTDDCWQEVRTLTCHEEEHVHTDDCFDEDGVTFICDKFEHVHDDSCYDIEYELVCGLEEGELVEEPNPDYVPADEDAFAVFDSGISVLPAADLQPVVDDSSLDVPLHHHTDACYEEELTCGLEEHHHTVNCLIDPLDGVDDESDWLSQTGASLTGLWTDDLLTVAQSQLGYEQSEKNFELDAADGVTVRHYTRYGAWYGSAYGPWDVTFLSYCLNYAGIPQSAVPQVSSVQSLHSQLRSVLYDEVTGSGYAMDFDGDMPFDAAMPGDIVIYNGTVTKAVAVESQPQDTLQVQDDSADADIALLSMDAPAAAETEPYIEEYTVTDKTVGIVSGVDETSGTLTVISGDVDGKVDEVSLSAAQVTTLVSVASAQAAAMQGSDTLDTPYIEGFNFNEVRDSSKGGFTAITIRDGNGTPITGSDFTLSDGDSINLTYDFSFPENGLAGMAAPVKLTFRLPEGIVLDEDSTFPLTLKNVSGDSIPAGEFTVSKDGLVTVSFDESFKTSDPFTGTLQFNVKASAGSDSSSDEKKISFPTGTEITVKKPTDIDFNKTIGSGPYMDGDGNIYIDYALTVSSVTGWKGKIILTDQLNNSADANGATGEYVAGSFSLSKVDANGTSTPVSNFNQPTVNGTEFTTDNLAEKYGTLSSNEKYVLTYKVKITNVANADGSAYFNNSAELNGGSVKKAYSTLPGRVDKSGSYNPDTGTVKWTVTVRNPYGKDLSGVTVTDTVQTAGATIQGNVTLKEKASDQNGWQEKVIDSAISPSENSTGFTYAFKAGSTGKEYEFTYVTTVPTDENGKAAPVENKAEVKENGHTYTDTGTAWPTDRSWSVNKSTAKSDLKSTDNSNEYLAYWKLSSDVPNNWVSYQYLDHIKSPSNGKHYGIAAELDKAIRENLLFTCVDGSTTLTAEQAGITVDIQYYSNEFDDIGSAPASADIRADDSTTPVKTFIITFKKGDKTLASPVKSMSVSQYYTHVDTSNVPEGATVQFYNNYSYYNYEHKAPKKNLIKNVSSHGSFGGDGNYSYTSPTSDENLYTGHNQEINYQLILDVTSFDNIGFSNDELTVTDTLPEGLKYKDGSAASYIGWSGYCHYHSSDAGYDFTDPENFVVTCTDGRHITFTFKNIRKLNIELTKASGGHMTDLIIRYTANVPDESWDRPQQTQNTYVNEAAWGEKKAQATLTLKRDTKPLVKSAEAVINDTSKESLVHYTLDINPTYSDLLTGSDTLTLTDVLTIENSNVTAHLDMDSVKLYDYPYQEGISQPLPTTSYQMSYTTDRNSSGQQTHTMKFTLDDSHGYVLKYDYVLDTNQFEVKLSNNAELMGVTDGKANSPTYSKTLSGSGGLSQSQIVLYKVDSLNELTRLQGAKFVLSSFANSTWTETDKQFHATDENGRILIKLGKNDLNQNGSEYLEIQPGILYRMEETEAPAGYAIQKDASTFYFAFGTSGQTADTIWNTVKDAAAKAGLTQNQVLLCGNGQQMNYTMQNTRIWLTIQKFWQDEYGNTLTGSNVAKDSIVVNLYRYPEGGTKDPSSQTNALVQSITLKKNPTLEEDGTTTPWTYVFTHTESGYRYYIVEANSDSLHDVTYSASNTEGVAGGGLLTLTNRLHKEYEKPGKLTINKHWLDSTGADITNTDNLSAEFTLTRHTKHTGGYTVTIVPSEGSGVADYGPQVFAKKVPQGAYLYFISNQGTSWADAATKCGLTLTYNVDKDEVSGQHVYCLGPITSDLRIVSTSLYTADNELLKIEGGTEVTDTVDKVIGTVTLDTSNGFSHTWTGLDTGDDITYTLTETNADGYTVSYQLNGNKLEGDTFTLKPDGSDTLDVTNQTSSGGYELPSTGGAGTKLYTAGGGALMLAALVCGFCTKRRRERRADR